MARAACFAQDGALVAHTLYLFSRRTAPPPYCAHIAHGICICAHGTWHTIPVFAQDGATPLLCALESGHPPIVQLLLDLRADPHKAWRRVRGVSYGFVIALRHPV